MHAAEKRQAYNYARRSCGEVRSMSYILLDNKFISAAEQTNLLQLCVQSGKLISGLIRSLNNKHPIISPRTEKPDTIAF